MGSSELSPRARRVLTTLVRMYIESGEPVASGALARASGLGVSSATIRNGLAQLEADGYVRQPHTSAGRIPTDRAYRVFVDLLLEGRRPARSSLSVENQLRQQAERSPLFDDVLVSATHLISRTARHVGFALAGSGSAVLQRVEFVPLGASRVLVVVVTRGNQVMQKVIECGEAVAYDDLVQAANYLNTEFAGLHLLEVREAVLARLQQERTLYDQLLTRALRLAHSTLDGLPDQHVFHLEGIASLLGSEDGVSVATLRALLEMMEEKARMVRLLNEYIDGPGLTVVIGAEHSSPDLRAFSLVASTVVEHGAMRTVGVIGPMRMHYPRAIALVDGTTRAVSRLLRGGPQTAAPVS
jgi:heat-inducible transcriptional repressor